MDDKKRKPDTHADASRGSQPSPSWELKRTRARLTVFGLGSMDYETKKVLRHRKEIGDK